MDALIDTTVEVETPEHVEIRLQVAGPARRALAYGIDLLVRGLILTLILGVVFVSMAAFGNLSEMVKAHEGLILIAYFALEWFYGVLLEWLWDGRTVGKRALGLRVVKESGAPIGLSEALLRNLLRAADLLPTVPVIPLPTYLVGGVVCASDSCFRRLGDHAAGTIVIVDAPTGRPAAAVIDPPPRPEEMALIPAHLRLSADERRTLDAFVRRLRAIHPAHAEEICGAYSSRLARRLGIAPPRSATRLLQLVYARLQETATSPRRRPA